MATTVGDVINTMQSLAPVELALPGDPIGLHAGDPEAPVTTVGVALEASLPVVEQAVKREVDMLVVHHPRFFKGLTTLAVNDMAGGRATAIALSGIAVFSAHTNLDVAPGGTNDVLARLAGLNNSRPVTVTSSRRLCKIAVYVPPSHAKAVRQAMASAGAGHIGRYSECFFQTEGVGTFRGEAGTDPFIGTPGKLESTKEFRIETVCPEHTVARVVENMVSAHPYEEVAYDIYPLRNRFEEYGLGRFGHLEKPVRLEHLARSMARVTKSTAVSFQGGKNATCRTAAVWAGGGVECRAFLSFRPDVVIAGEVGYHETENFADAGIAVINLGHGFSELPSVYDLTRRLSSRLKMIKVITIRDKKNIMKNVFYGS